MYKYAIGTLISLASLSASAYNAQCMDSLCGHKTGTAQEACYRSITNQQQCDASINNAILANRVSDIEYAGIATIRDQNVIYTLKSSLENEFKPLISRSSSIISNLERAEDQIKRAFRSEIEKSATENEGSIRYFSFSIDRPRNGLDISIYGLPNGETKIKIDSVRLSLSTYLKASKHGFRLWDGNIDINTGTVSFEGDYNLRTGQISNLAPLNYNPSIQVDFDTRKIFDLFGGSTDDYMRQLETQTRDSLRDSLDTVFSTIANNTTSFLGLEDAIPSGEYVINGIDAGQIIKSAILNGDFEEVAQIKITPVSKTFQVHPEIGYRTYKTAKVNLTYGDEISLEVKPIVSVGKAPAPVLSDGRFGTPRDSDLPNTNMGPIEITSETLPTTPPSGSGCSWRSISGAPGVTVYGSFGPCNYRYKEVYSNGSVKYVR